MTPSICTQACDTDSAWIGGGKKACLFVFEGDSSVEFCFLLPCTTPWNWKKKDALPNSSIKHKSKLGSTSWTCFTYCSCTEHQSSALRRCIIIYTVYCLRLCYRLSYILILALKMGKNPIRLKFQLCMPRCVCHLHAVKTEHVKTGINSLYCTILCRI